MTEEEGIPHILSGGAGNLMDSPQDIGFVAMIGGVSRHPFVFPIILSSADDGDQLSRFAGQFEGVIQFRHDSQKFYDPIQGMFFDRKKSGFANLQKLVASNRHDLQSFYRS